MKKLCLWVIVFLIVNTHQIISAPLWRTWECSGTPAIVGTNGVIIQQAGCVCKGSSWLWGDRCMWSAGACTGNRSGMNNADCNQFGMAAFPPATDAPYGTMPGFFDAHPMQTYVVPGTGEVIHFTMEYTVDEMKTRLIAAGYTPHDEWFATPEAGLFPCPEPVRDLPVTEPSVYAYGGGGCSMSSFIINPNPTTGLFTIHYDNFSQIQQIVVTNLQTGDVPYMQNSNFLPDIVINLSGQADGVYAVIMLTTSGILTKQLVIETGD